MGWIPQPRYDKSKGIWYGRINGVRRTLGRSEPEAWQRWYSLRPDAGHSARGWTPLVVAQLISAWLAQHADDRGWGECMLNMWDAKHGATRLDQIPACHLEDLAAALKAESYSPQTIKHVCKFAGRCLQWAFDHEWVAKVPRRPKLFPCAPRPKPVADDALAAALAEIKYARDILTFIRLTGSRPAEACRLKWTDFDADMSKAVLYDHKTWGKTGRPRVIYISDQAREILDRQCKHATFVFLNKLKRPYNTTALRMTLRQHGITTYQLRHSFITEARRKVGPDLAAKLAGHNDLRMLKFYSELTDADALAALSRMASHPEPLRQEPQSCPGADSLSSSLL